jgi:hypothetical protein
VLYAFDLPMLRGKDVRLWPLDDRRGALREIIASLPDVIRFSETFNVPLPELMGAVRKHQLEGIVAKRAGSPYRSGERSLTGSSGELIAARSSWSAVTFRMATFSISSWSGTTRTGISCTLPASASAFLRNSAGSFRLISNSCERADAHTSICRIALRGDGAQD